MRKQNFTQYCPVFKIVLLLSSTILSFLKSKFVKTVLSGIEYLMGVSWENFVHKGLSLVLFSRRFLSHLKSGKYFQMYGTLKQQC